MPALWLDRLPLPNLPAYTAISVMLLLCSVYFAITTQQTFEQDAISTVTFSEAMRRQCIPQSRNSSVDQQRTLLSEYFYFINMYPTQEVLQDSFLRHKLKSDFLNWSVSGGGGGSARLDCAELCASSTVSPSVSHFYVPRLYHNASDEWRPQLPVRSISSRLAKTLAFMIHEPLCVWTLINMAYCVLVLLGKSIQQSMFGELRVSEQTQLKDKFWNFVFYKFIFVFGVINVQHMDEVVLWCSWFSALGFLHLLTQLCRDRFEYLSLSASTPRRTHARLLCLLSAILGLSLLLLTICIYVGLVADANTFAFMAAECVLLLIRTLHTMARYGIHLFDLTQTKQWERKGSLVYTTGLCFEMTELLIDLLHHGHMLLWGNILLSMASLIIFMELRHIFYQMQHRLRRHNNYRRVVRYIDECSAASVRDLADTGDQCAICWDALHAARRLDCKHCFHPTCLRQWLEQDLSCPTCRIPLDLSREQGGGEGRLSAEERSQRRPQQRSVHWPQHRGSRFVSFLPSFSVEVNHTQLVRGSQQEVVPASQLDTMARQVQQLFPHVSLSAIVEDLQQSGSMEATVENILDGSVQDLPAPPIFSSDELEPVEPPPAAATDSQTPAAPRVTEPQQRMDGRDSPPTASEPVPEMTGSRFSKSPSERQSLLEQRKQTMLERARRRYLANAATVAPATAVTTAAETPGTVAPATAVTAAAETPGTDAAETPGTDATETPGTVAAETAVTDAAETPSTDAGAAPPT